MKYVLWGMGANGLELYSYLPNCDVCMIIDQDRENVTIRSLKKKAISFEEYLNLRHSLPYHIIVICPFKYGAMENLLLSHGITNYSVLKKSAVGMLAYASVFNDSYKSVLNLRADKKYYLFKKGFFQELLFLKMTESRYDVVWVDSEKQQSKELSEDYINEIYYNGHNEKLIRLRNTLYGKRVFVIGTGPSLIPEDLETLKKHDCVTFAVNSIFNIFDKTDWRPNYYLASDRAQLEEYFKTKWIHNALKHIKKIFSDNFVELVLREGDDKNTFFFRQIQSYDDIRFSTDCSKGVYCSNTIIYATLQLAVFMGAEEIVLLGCDNGFIPGSKIHFYNERSWNSSIEIIERNALEAHKDMEVGYRVAKEVADCQGISILNATRGGYLETFKRVSFDALFDRRL